MLRAAALGAVALVGTGVALAAADSTGSTPSTATTPTSGGATVTTSTAQAPATIPAPAGFAASIIRIYTDQYHAATALDSASSSLSGEQLPGPSTFTQSVDDLTPAELSALYAASQQDPNWNELGGALSTVDTDSRRYAASSASRVDAFRARRSGKRPTARSRTAGRQAARETGADEKPFDRGAIALGAGSVTPTFPPASPTATIPTPPATFNPSQPVGPSQVVTCPAGAPGGPDIAPGDDAIYAAQLTSDVAANLASDLDPTITIAGFSIPDPAKYVAEAIALAGQVTLDTLSYYQQVFADCDGNDDDSILANIDNTTQQLYSLESQYIQPTVDAIQSSLSTIHQQVQVVQQSADEQLTVDVEQALSAGTGSGSPPPNFEFTMPASDGGDLNSLPVGIQEVVTNALSQAQSAHMAINAIVTRDLAAANDALSAGQYRTAYNDYQAAYQGLG